MKLTRQKISFSNLWLYGLVGLGALFILLYSVSSGFYHQRLAYQAWVMACQEEEFQNRVWAHRVNSIGKAKEAAGIYRGIEIDVWLTASYHFDVNHSRGESVGLSLAALLTELDEPHRLSYWLDFKNLTRTNLPASITRLQILCKRFGIAKQSVIVESKSHELLRYFSKRGFRTSYYLPTSLLSVVRQKGIGDLSAMEENRLKQLENTIRTGRFDYVSTGSGYQPALEEVIDVKKEILLWTTELKQHSFFDRRKIRSILSQDSRVKVLLTKFSSKFDR
ncbi:MAG: hypothetical protein ABFS19_09355 [Thermodesulfobacteriota bacterium]